jgi:hypothetical protein
MDRPEHRTEEWACVAGHPIDDLTTEAEDLKVDETTVLVCAEHKTPLVKIVS